MLIDHLRAFEAKHGELQVLLDLLKSDAERHAQQHHDYADLVCAPGHHRASDVTGVNAPSSRANHMQTLQPPLASLSQRATSSPFGPGLKSFGEFHMG